MQKDKDITQMDPTVAQRVYLICNSVDEKTYQEIYTKKIKPGQQIQKFDALIMQGLEMNGCDVTCYSTVPVSKDIVDYRCKRLENREKHVYTLSFNNGILKDIYTVLSSFFSTLFRKKGLYLFDPLAPAICVGTLVACKVRRNKTVCIVTDLPEHMSPNKLYQRMVNFVIRHSSAYVFLTEETNTRLNPNRKPFIVMEGLVPVDTRTPLSYENRKKSIIYAGKMTEDNGIYNLLDAFVEWNQADYDLYFYGDGEDREQLEKRSKGYPNVHCEGMQMNAQLLPILENATLLVNPRGISEEYTHYSFPSKLLEYLNSGTCVISTELPGISTQFYPYFISAKDGSVSAILESLKKAHAMTMSEKSELANHAKEYMQKNMTCDIQAKKILKLSI